jgi:hypothetical protein
MHPIAANAKVALSSLEFKLYLWGLNSELLRFNCIRKQKWVVVHFASVRQRLDAKSEPDRGSDRPNTQLYRIGLRISCCYFWSNLWPVATAIRF